MKKLFRSIFTLAVAGLALVSCNKADEVNPQDSEKGYKYAFSVVDDFASTKATLGTDGVCWVSGDRVGMFLPGYAGYANIDMDKTPKEVILYSKSIIPSGSKAYAYYPYSADNTADDDEAARILLSRVQQGGTLAAMPMAGIPFTVENEVAAQTNQNGVIKFLNLGSIVEFNVFSSNREYLTESVQSIVFTTEPLGQAVDYISGEAYVDLTQVDASDASTLELNFTNADASFNTVTVNQVAEVAAAKDEASAIYMVLAPGDHAGNIVINTDKASYFWSISSPMTFKRNGIKHFNMDLANATRGTVTETVKKLPYEEPFSSDIGDFTTDGAQVAGTDVWQFASGMGMKATAYISGTRYETESKLISPWIDLTDGIQYAVVSFDHAYRYITTATEDLTLWVLTDDTEATWTQLTIPNYSSGTNWTFVNSGEISLNSYVGKKVKLAFQYTSTSTAAATWEIKNFSVKEISEPVTADPVISFDSKTNTVTITCPTEGAHIGYTTDGTEPGIDDETGDPSGTTMEYTEPFTITESCTVKAFAGADHMEISGVVSLECKVAGDYDFETIAELNALATTAATSFSGHLTNAVVSYVPATNTAIIKDATGSVMYYKSGHGLKQGQTFTGDITVTLQLYNSLYTELTDMSATFTGDETVVEPETLALSSLVGNYSTYQNAYVKVENLEVTSVSTSDSGSNVNVTDGTNTYVVFTNKFSSSVSVGDVITAIGTVTKYQTTEEIKVWKAENLIVTTSHTATEHTITIVQPEDAGTSSIKVTVDGSEITSGTKVMEGKEVQAEVTIDGDYDFTTWDITGAVGLSSKTSHVVTFNVGTEDITVAGNFVKHGAKSYTITWNSTNNSQSISSYEKTWSVTADGLTCNMANWNNNNNSWNYVKCGRRNNTSVATITTASAISEAIKTVTMTIDAITTAKINSITLYVSDSADSGWTSAGTFTKATGNQSVTIAEPAADKYYKIEVDCDSGSSNGLLTLSQLVFSE